MLVYLLMYAYTLFLAFLFFYRPERKEELKWLLLPLFLLYFCVMAFRQVGVGSDTLSYVPIFERNSMSVPSITEMFSSRFEPGFIWLNQFLRLFTDNYTVLFIAYALPTVGIWFYVLYKQSKNVYLSIFLYLAGNFYMFAMSGIRNGLAVSFTFLAFHFFTKNYRILPAFLIFLGMLFHTSAIIFFLIYPLSKVKLSPRFVLLASGATLILYPFVDRVILLLLRFFPKYLSYTDTTWFTAGVKLTGILSSIMFVLIFLLGEFVLRGKKDQTQSERLMHVLFIFSVFFVLLGSRTALMARFVQYFSVYATLYIPYFLSTIQNKRWLTVCFYGLIIAYTLFLFVPLIWRPEWHSVTPYRTVLTDWLFGTGR